MNSSVSTSHRIRWWIVRSIIVVILKVLTKTSIEGLEKIDSIKGKAIVASNHLGTLDAAFAFWVVRRPDLIMVVAEKYRTHPVFSILVKQLNLLFIERFEADFGTLRETLRRLDRGGILFIAPEGTRSRTEALLEGKPGVAYIASKSGAPVVPAVIYGSEDRVVGDNLLHWRRSRIHIVVGEAFTLPPLPHENRDVFLKQQTEEIMARIAALLPEKYRGFYAENPRLRELLA